jgi:hypothetical protein
MLLPLRYRVLLFGKDTNRTKSFLIEANMETVERKLLFTMRHSPDLI